MVSKGHMILLIRAFCSRLIWNRASLYNISHSCHWDFWRLKASANQEIQSTGHLATIWLKWILVPQLPSMSPCKGQHVCRCPLLGQENIIAHISPGKTLSWPWASCGRVTPLIVSSESRLCCGSQKERCKNQIRHIRELFSTAHEWNRYQ